MVQNNNKVNQVRLELYASKLKNVAGSFKGTSDPYAVVTLLSNNPSEKPTILGKTEVVQNSLNPKWTQCFDLPFEIGDSTRINVAVFDEVKKGSHKPMGSCMFEVGEVLGSRGNIKAKNLRNGGVLYARITPVPDAVTSGGGNPGTLIIKLKGEKLANVDGTFLSKTDPFFELSIRVDAAGGLTWQPIYRSKHILNNLNPLWEEFSLDLSRLLDSTGKETLPVQFKLYDWQKNGKHIAIGSFETTTQGFLNAAGDPGKAFTVVKRGKQIAGKIVVVSARVENASESPPAFSQSLTFGSAATAGENLHSTHGRTGLASSLPTQASPPLYDNLNAPYNISLTNIAPIQPPAGPYNPSYNAHAPPAVFVPGACLPLPHSSMKTPTFVDYLAGGMELELCIAIDFTGSNGDPRKPGSLHYIHPDGSLNDYEKAITAVGGVIGKYDHDQLFTAWGFGAKYGGVVQHCFQVGPQTELSGLSGVLDGYRGVFRSGLVMSGPTVFAEVISMAAVKGRSAIEHNQSIGKQSYTVLLILTDGAVSDIEMTKRALHDASDAPLSIVIVGIGNADFSAMQFLDDFQNNSSGRDICQFVPFSQYSDDRRALTIATLQEIPDQCVEYFSVRGIRPLPPVHGSQMNLNVEDPGEEDIDLNLTFGEDGDINLANYDGAIYDDTKYGVSNNYAAPSAPLESTLQSTSCANNVAGDHLYQHAQSTQPYQPNKQPQIHAHQQQVPHEYQPPPFSQALHNPPPSFTLNSNSSRLYTQSTPVMSQPSSYTSGGKPYVASQTQGLQGGSGNGVPRERIFYVRVPKGAYPGTQLQLQNPHTGQQMRAIVPQGVSEGGSFGVRY